MNVNISDIVLPKSALPTLDSLKSTSLTPTFNATIKTIFLCRFLVKTLGAVSFLA